MTYEEAFKIGSVAEGAILATCAEFWDMDGRKLFSFQRANSSVVIEDSEDIPKIVVDGKELAIVSVAESYKLVDFNNQKLSDKDGGLNVDYNKLSLNDINNKLSLNDINNKLSLNDIKALSIRGNEAQLAIDFPIVRAAYYTEPKNGKVPVYILPDAIDELKRRVLHKEKYYYVDCSYKMVKNGDWYDIDTVKKRVYEGLMDIPLGSISQEESGVPYNCELKYVANIAWPKKGKRRVGENARQYKEFFDIYNAGNYEAALDYLISKKRQYLETALNDKGGLLFPVIIFDYQITKGNYEGYSEKYQIVIDKLKRGTQFMVKTAAFDWFATNIDNATIATTDANGKTISLSVADYLAQAKAKLDKAKTLIAAAGAATIL